MIQLSKLSVFSGAIALAGVIACSSGFAQNKKVAIANLGPHPALNAVISGVKKGLAQGGFEEGKTLNIEYKDANFDSAIVAQMITALEATRPDLFVTVTTPITQASKRIVRNKKTPIVFAPVTDPVDAGLVKSWDHGSARFVGASNLQSMETVLGFAKKLLGPIKTIGLLYNPGDANDVVNVKYAQAAVDKLGITLKAVSVESTNDIPVRVVALKGVDFIYLIPSSMLQPAMPAVAAAANRIKVPVINASPGGVKQGLVLASMSVSWFEVGRQAGVRAAKILNGASPSALSTYRPSPADHKPMISAKRLIAVGMTVPAALADCQCVQ